MKKYFMSTVGLMLIGVLIFGSVISVSATVLPLYGDVNDDGIISVDDITEVQKYLAKISEFSQEELIIADYNGDGKVNILDVTDIQKISSVGECRIVELGYLKELKSKSPYDIFYGNMDAEKKNKGIIAEHKLTIICFNKELREYINKVIGDFFIVTNFGTTRGKRLDFDVP